MFQKRRACYGLAQTSVDQFRQPYNGISNAPVYMKINKSVKKNITFTVLLFIPKETNWSFYDIESIKRGVCYFTAVTKDKLVSWALSLAVWIEFLKPPDLLHLLWMGGLCAGRVCVAIRLSVFLCGGLCVCCLSVVKHGWFPDPAG